MNYTDEITAADYEDLSHDALVLLAVRQYNDLAAFRVSIKEYQIHLDRLKAERLSLVNAISANRHQIALGNTFIAVLGEIVGTLSLFEHAGNVTDSDYARFYSMLTGIISIAPTLYTYLEQESETDNGIPF